MTDKELVERLNAYSAQYQNHGGITAEAADRIEQLHAELTNERIDNTNLIGELATVAAERDRYKAEHENLRPPTNADRIREMSDEELAYFLVDCNPANCQQCAFSSGWRCDPDREDYSDAEKCTEGRKRWLQQPAEEAQ